MPVADEPTDTPPTGADLANDYFEKIFKSEPFVAAVKEAFVNGQADFMAMRISYGPEGVVVEPINAEEMLISPTRATEIKSGVTLHTKDGSKMGNAIVLAKIGQTRVWDNLKSSNYEMQDIWLIETDFGNHVRLSVCEIEELFTLGFESNYERGSADRLDLIRSSVENGG